MGAPQRSWGWLLRWGLSDELISWWVPWLSGSRVSGEAVSSQVVVEPHSVHWDWRCPLPHWHRWDGYCLEQGKLVLKLHKGALNHMKPTQEFQILVSGDSMHHCLVYSSNKLDTVVNRAGLVHNSTGTMPLGSQFPAVTSFICRSIQPNPNAPLRRCPHFPSCQMPASAVDGLASDYCKQWHRHHWCTDGSLPQILLH